MLADERMFWFIHNLAGKSRLLDFLGIFFSEYFGYFLLASALLMIFSLDGWKSKVYYLSFLSLALILSRGLLTELIRFFYYRPRPFLILEITPLIDQASKGSFPSGHAAFYFALAGMIFLMNKKAGWYFFAGALLIGAARIFVGVHWPLDILGGLAVGLISVLAVNQLLDRSTP
jgi:undecaprenyl-diphosphatase